MKFWSSIPRNTLLKNLNARMTLLAVVSVAAAFAACSAPPPSPLPPAREVKSVTVNGTPRSYILRFPKSYDGTRPAPLVMLLHGATDSAAYAEAAYHMDEKGEAAGFVLVLPDAVGTYHAWESAADSPAGRNDLAFLTTLLEELPRTYAIDPARVYVAGHSSGAIMTYRLAIERPDLIAAIGIVAGEVSDAWPAPRAPMPLIAFHGRQDMNLPYPDLAEALAFWTKINRSGAPVTSALSDAATRQVFTPAPGGAEMVAYTLERGNHMWPGGRAMPGKSEEPMQDLSATDLMWDFFNAHPRKPAVAEPGR